jgi:hypothetical protein
MSKKNGKGDPNAITYLNGALTVFNTCNVHPDEIIYAKGTDGTAIWQQKAIEVIRDFKKKFNAGDVVRQAKKGTMITSDGDNDPSNYVKAIRQFLAGNNCNLPKLPPEHELSGKKGDLFGAYNMIGLTDVEHDKMLDFFVKESKDYGYVGACALMAEMITRTESIFAWKINVQTEYDEFENTPVEFDFVKGFFEKKTAKSKPQGWDKYIINPRARKILAELAKDRAGKTLVDYTNLSKTCEIMNDLCTQFYITIGKLDETASLPRMINKTRNKNRTYYPKGTDAYYYDSRGAYVLRHTGAHRWCRRTKYDYGFVSELGWGDMNTLKKCYAGMDLRSLLRASMCMYCKPPQNPSQVQSHLFCSATHAFIYYSNGGKSKRDQSLETITHIDDLETIPHKHNTELVH